MKPAAIDAKEVHNPHIKKLVNTMADKVFDGKVKLFQVFRKFDKDYDGYISYEDFGKCLESIRMDVSKEDQAKMMKLIDKNNNGYISFPEFSKVFKPTMSDELVSVAQKDSYLPNLQPSKDKNNQNLDKQTKFVETVNDIKRSFEPNHDNRKLQSNHSFF